MYKREESVIVIVGGAGGIGRAACRRLARCGHKMVLAGRDATRLNKAAEDVGADAYVLDARDSSAVDAMLAETQTRLGRLDGVVNCAGSLVLKPAHLLSDEDFSSTLATNLTTTFNLVRAAARIMMRQPGGGSMVLCSSVAAQRGLVNHEAIAAAKAGVEGLARSAAATYARYGVRVNCVAPGLTRTPLAQPLLGHEATAKASAALHPLGRVGEADEVASAICWLLDREQGWVTGQVLAVDGGLGSVQARP